MAGCTDHHHGRYQPRLLRGDNGLVALGNTDGESSEAQLSGTPQGAAIASAFAAIGRDVVWVNDIAYQPNHGNVHCSTNTLREPEAAPFWARR